MVTIKFCGGYLYVPCQGYDYERDGDRKTLLALKENR